MRIALRVGVAAIVAFTATAPAWARDEEPEHERMGTAVASAAERAVTVPAMGSVTDYLTFDAQPAAASHASALAAVTPAVAATGMTSSARPRAAPWLRTRDGYRDGGY